MFPGIAIVPHNTPHTNFDVAQRHYQSTRAEPLRMAGVLPDGEPLLDIDQVIRVPRTFEAVLDAIIAHQSPNYLLVDHGHAEQGLTVPLAADVPLATGPLVAPLAEAADLIGPHLDNPLASFVTGIAERLWREHGATPADPLRLVRKLEEVRARRFDRFEIRGCNVGAQVWNIRNLRWLLGCREVAGPRLFMNYLSVDPGRPVSSLTVQSYPQEPGRRRLLTGPALGVTALDRLLLIINHRNLSSDPSRPHWVWSTFCATTNGTAGTWARALNLRWHAGSGSSFTVALMRDDGHTAGDQQFALPAELAYRTAIVTSHMA